jgi:hypothetical protein
MHPSWCAVHAGSLWGFRHMFPSNQEKALLVKIENNHASHLYTKQLLIFFVHLQVIPPTTLMCAQIDNTTWPLQRKGMKRDFVMLEKKKLFSKHQANT